MTLLSTGKKLQSYFPSRLTSLIGRSHQNVVNLKNTTKLQLHYEGLNVRIEALQQMYGCT